MNNLNLSSWEDCEARVKSGFANPLDIFLYLNEPAGKEESKQFRRDLENLLKWTLNEN